MKTITLLLLLSFMFVPKDMYSQTPFSAAVREPILLKKTESLDGTERFVEVNSRYTITAVNSLKGNHFMMDNLKILDTLNKLNKTTQQLKEKEDESLIKYLNTIKGSIEKKLSTSSDILTEVQLDSIKKSVNETYINVSKNVAPDFFRNNSLSISLLDKGENRLSARAQVLHYKLYVANPNERNTFRSHRYNIPLFIITKLSTSYDSISSSSAIDVLDYEGAPITIRVMPSWKFRLNNYSDVFDFGFYADLRGLNLFNSNSNDYNIEFLGSGGFGFTYQADGKAGSYEQNGEYADGRYSISFMLQGAIGDNKVIRQLFKTDRDVISSLQGYFLFTVKENSPLNIKVGYQYFFDEMLSGNRTNLSIALGFSPKK